jgi:enoyl-CoA hydratase/carnithine racemase
MVETEFDDGFCTITINRPDKANALTGEILAGLDDAVRAAGTRADVKAIAITGRGKVFSAGMDLEAAKGGLAKDAIWEKLSGAIADAPCLTIAVLNGTVAGGAIGMVLACDLRVAVPSSKVFYPVMKLGFLPQPSDPARLVALIGPAKAKLILMGGQKVDAETAASWGLIDRLSDDPIAEARALAADALGADRDHVTAIKSMFPS